MLNIMQGDAYPIDFEFKDNYGYSIIPKNVVDVVISLGAPNGVNVSYSYTSGSVTFVYVNEETGEEVDYDTYLEEPSKYSGYWRFRISQNDTFGLGSNGYREYHMQARIKFNDAPVDVQRSVMGIDMGYVNIISAINKEIL